MRKHACIHVNMPEISKCKKLATCRNSQYVKMSTCMWTVQKKVKNILGPPCWHAFVQRFFLNMHVSSVACKKKRMSTWWPLFALFLMRGNSSRLSLLTSRGVTCWHRRPSVPRPKSVAKIASTQIPGGQNAVGAPGGGHEKSGLCRALNMTASTCANLVWLPCAPSLNPSQRHVQLLPTPTRGAPRWVTTKTT